MDLRRPLTSASGSEEASWGCDVGDMADFYLDLADPYDFVEAEEDDPSPGITCKECGTSLLTWKKILLDFGFGNRGVRWRLFSREGEMHSCHRKLPGTPVRGSKPAAPLPKKKRAVKFPNDDIPF